MTEHHRPYRWQWEREGRGGVKEETDSEQSFSRFIVYSVQKKRRKYKSCENTAMSAAICVRQFVSLSSCRRPTGVAQVLSSHEPFFSCSSLVVTAGSPSRGRDAAVYVSDIKQPSLPTPFHSVLVSISVFTALSTIFLL